MPTDSFPNIDVDVSSQRVTFAEAGLAPKWILDVSFFAGQPALNASRTDVQRKNQEITTLTITLTNARYPGTNLIADLTVELQEINNLLSGQITSTVKATLAFANVTFVWSSDQFVDWLNGVSQQTAQISPSGQLVVLGAGGISFGPAVTATLTFTPGLLSIAAPQVCSFNVFGVDSTGTSVSLTLAASAAETTTTVHASAAFAASVPAATPIGSLTSSAGFDTLVAVTTEASKVATFSSSQAQTCYTLQLLGGVSDLNGGPVRFDLAGVRLEIDFTSSPQRFILIGPGRASTSLLIAAGIGLSIPQPSDGSGTLGINLFFDGQQWNVQTAVLPLPGLFLPLDDGIAEPGAPLGTDFSLFPSGPNWIALGNLAAGAPRLHFEDFRLHVARPQDLLNLEIQCLNMAMEVLDGGVPTLKPNTKGQAIWRVIFPPQHIVEQAFYQGDQQPNLKSGRTDDPLVTPTGARLAGPSQLAFLVPAELAPFPITLANLLDWKRFELAGTSLDNPGQPAPLQNPDLDRQTAIEIPYRLLLSLDNASAWSHNVTTASDLSELWNTRLAFRKALASGGFVIDERASSGTRQGRAFWTPDFVTPVDPFDKTHGSLNSDQRQQIVHLTCDAAGAHTFDVKQMMLTNLGATTDIDTNWNPPQGFHITLWQNILSFGRDQFIRVGRRGCCHPWGHRATRVTVSERRFIAQPDGSQAVAYLVQFDYVIITQPVRFYSGLDWPFREIEFITRVTPTLSKPQNLTDANGTPFNAFWIEIDNNQPFLFDFKGIDLQDRPVRFQAPAIFVDDLGNFDQNVNVAVSHYQSDTTINTPVAFARQKIAFAPSGDPEDTSFETDSVSLASADLRPGGSGSWKDAAGDVFFRPKIGSASIHHAASAALAGTSDTLIPVTYFPQYVQQSGLHAAAAADGVDVFLGIVQPPKFQLTSAQTGVAAPAYALTAISKKLGAVGGDPTQILQQGTINPSQFLDAGAKFLANIPLSGILPDVIPKIPNLNTVVNSTNGVPTSAVTTFEWHPPLRTDKLSFGPLKLTFTDPNLDLKVQITTQLAAPGGVPPAPTSLLTGHAGKFDLVFTDTDTDLVAVHFHAMDFTSQSGQKPKIDVQLEKPPMDFLGALGFVNALRDVIPNNGFSPPPPPALPLQPATLSADEAPTNGPFLDVGPNGINAGFSLSVPSVGIGVFSLENIRLGAAIELPFTSDPVTFDFHFGERDHKFLLTVDLLAGGGFLAIELSSQGIERLEFAIEFGANVALNLFVATGSVHVLAGAHLTFDKAKGTTDFSAYLRAGGELTVLGLVSISVEFTLELHYRCPQGDLYGIATLTVEVSVAFISKKVDLTLERSFPGSGPCPPTPGQAILAAASTGPAGPPTLDLLFTQDNWAAYAGAFA